MNYCNICGDYPYTTYCNECTRYLHSPADYDISNEYQKNICFKDSITEQMRTPILSRHQQTRYDHFTGMKSTRQITFDASPDELIDAYHPIFYIHPKERYPPMDVEDYLRKSSLREIGSNAVKMTDLSFDKINARLDEFPPTSHYIIPSNRGRNVAREPPSGHQTLYASVAFVPEENVTIITYVLFFGFNEGFPPLATILPFGRSIGDHWGDIERCHVRIDNKTGNIISVFTGAHGDERRWSKEFITEAELLNNLDRYTVSYLDTMKNNYPIALSNETHPIIFIANGGHGTYPLPGKFRRLKIIYDETSVSGFRWMPRNVMVIPHSFMLYRGCIGAKYAKNKLVDSVDSYACKEYLHDVLYDKEPST